MIISVQRDNHELLSNNSVFVTEYHLSATTAGYAPADLLKQTNKRAHKVKIYQRLAHANFCCGCGGTDQLIL